MSEAVPSSLPDPTQRLITAAETQAADRAAIAQGLSIDRLMDAAGRAVAASARDMLDGHRGEPRPIAILCGPGGNGGDGYVAARVLAGWGLPVRLHADRPPSPDTPAERARQRCGLTVEPLSAFRPHESALAIDALYGAGLTRGLHGTEADAVAAMARAGVPVLAVDLPSGLCADSGVPLGPVCPATRTVTFFRRKPAHLLWPGRQLCGEVVVAEIGLTKAHLNNSGDAGSGAAGHLWRNHPALWRTLASRGNEMAVHKYDRGHVHVVSGPPLRTGASRLSAQAALHAGAGAVTLHGSLEALMIHAAHVTAVMLAPSDGPAGLAAAIGARGRVALVIGPALGLEAEAQRWLDAALELPAPLVLDADAITLLAQDASRLPVLMRRGAHAQAVLTPHAGEFARLFGERLGQDPVHAALPARLRQSKVEQARAAARLSGAVIVFKGADTVIAAPDGRAAINDNAGPELATAGSGDVLAGIIAAQLAAGHPAFEAAAGSVWLHGAAGASVGIGLTAERLVAAMKPLQAFLPAGT